MFKLWYGNGHREARQAEPGRPHIFTSPPDVMLTRLRWVA
jgi:hypothetical protein